jgi:hypothetical protein
VIVDYLHVFYCKTFVSRSDTAGDAALRYIAAAAPSGRSPKEPDYKVFLDVHRNRLPDDNIGRSGFGALGADGDQVCRSRTKLPELPPFGTVFQLGIDRYLDGVMRP